ncbi:MAG: FkbM family methyltransferase [Bacteroidales bacterium]|nr:FkbM family methyltransferase [Bacteroidales bacterium]
MKLFKLLKSIIPNKQKQIVKSYIYNHSPFRFDFRQDKNLNSLKRKINLYFLIFPLKRKAFIKEINFLNREAKQSHSFSFIFPYSFVFNYDFDHIYVNKDDVKGLYYVIHKGKRLYYSRDYKSALAVKESYSCISIEQDKKSPHRYIDENFNVEENDVVIDIGAAEGNFSLEVVERVNTLFIFETNINWIEALNATFEPWKEKVHIINKYISNIDNDKCATLYSLFKDISINFIKMDVEGAEVLILKNLEKLLASNSVIKLALCTYHSKNDAKTITEILTDNKFHYSFSNGYMLFIYSILTPPYFRKGLVRAQKIYMNEELQTVSFT